MESSGRRSAQVVSLAEHRQSASTIEYVRELLREAESGRLVGILAAIQYAGGDLGYVGAGELCANRSYGVHALSELTNRLLQS